MVKTEGVSEQERSSHVRRRSCNGGQEGPLREGGFEERAEGVRKGAIQKLWKNAAGRNRAPSAALPEGACRARKTQAASVELLQESRGETSTVGPAGGSAKAASLGR